MTVWQRPAGCESGACVEVDVNTDDNPGLVFVRSSLRPHDEVFFDATEWAAFVAAVKAGQFDGEVKR